MKILFFILVYLSLSSINGIRSQNDITIKLLDYDTKTSLMFGEVLIFRKDKEVIDTCFNIEGEFNITYKPDEISFLIIKYANHYPVKVTLKELKKNNKVYLKSLSKKNQIPYYGEKDVNELIDTMQIRLNSEVEQLQIEWNNRALPTPKIEKAVPYKGNH